MKTRPHPQKDDPKRDSRQPVDDAGAEPDATMARDDLPEAERIDAENDVA